MMVPDTFMSPSNPSFLINNEKMPVIQFAYKLVSTDIYAHLLYRIHPGGRSKIEQVDIVNILREAVSKANAYLHHERCNIVILANADFAIPEEGVGGMSWSTDWIRIDIDSGHARVGKNIEKNLPPAVAHELHHVAREKQTGYGKTLGEVLVTEGLAQAFEEFVYPGRRPPYAHHLSSVELEKTWKRASSQLQDNNYDHSAWFYGSDKLKLKRWAGYSLGYDIIRQYLGQNPAENPVTLVGAPAQKILKDYQLK